MSTGKPTSMKGEHSVFDLDGHLIDYLNSDLRNAYYEFADGERTLVAGDERLYFPGWW